MTGEYDLAFSLGQACACSMSLRTARLQYASFPLDWIAGGTIDSRVKLITDRFPKWLEAEDFVYLGRNEVNGLGKFINNRTGLCHLHDFADAPLATSLDGVVAKYARRERRFFALVGRSHRILVAYVNSASGNNARAPTTDDVSTARRNLMLAFPNAAFDFVHFVLDRDIPFERRVVTTPAEGVTEVRFDYHDDEKDVSCTTVADALLSLGIKVRDYRTKAERKAHSLKKQMKKYGVDSRFALFMAKVREHIARLSGLGAEGKKKSR